MYLLEKNPHRSGPENLHTEGHDIVYHEIKT